MASGRTCRLEAGIVAREPPGIRGRVCGGHSTCHATATCVHDPEPGERPDYRRRSSNAPGCGSTFAALHGTPAGHTTESKKNFCCVTTRRRNFRVFRWLRRRGRPLTAQAFRLRVLRLRGGVQAAAGLTLCRLPAPDLTLALRILAVTLVPATRLVLLSAAFAQADPLTRTARSGTARVVGGIVVRAHGRTLTPKG